LLKNSKAWFSWTVSFQEEGLVEVLELCWLDLAGVIVVVLGIRDGLKRV